MLCPFHYERIEPTLGICWRCLAQEVDPPDDLPSWWWSGWRDPEYLGERGSPDVLDREQEEE